MGHPMGIFSYGIAPVRSHPHVQYHVIFSLPMSCGKEFPQLMIHFVKQVLLSLLCRWQSDLGFVHSASRFSQVQEEQPYGLGLCKLWWPVLATGQSQHVVEWKTVLRRQCHQHGALYISLYNFMLAVINLPRFLSHVLEWTSHSVISFSIMIPIKNLRRKFDLQGHEKSYQRHLLLDLLLCLLK